MGGKDYVAEGLRIDGTPDQVMQRLGEWFRELAFLQNSGNEASAILVEGTGSARLLPALAIGPHAKANSEDILRVVDLPEARSVKRLFMWHSHPTGAIEHVPSGVNVDGLHSQAALSSGDLTWTEDVLESLSGRSAQPELADLAGRLPKLNAASVASYDPLTDTVTRRQIAYRPDGIPEWSAPSVLPGTPGNQIADVVTIGPQVLSVSPGDGVIPMEAGTVAKIVEQANTFRQLNADGTPQPSLREVLQDIALRNAFGNVLPPIGGRDGAIMTASQFRQEFGTAIWYLWPGLDRIPDPDTTLLHLMVPQMTVSAETPSGEIAIPAAFPINPPTHEQQRVLNAGTGNTPQQATAYFDVLREMISPRRSGSAGQPSY